MNRNPRLTGIDIARLIAIAGMIMVHFGPNPTPETNAGQIYELSHGRASILFALLAGIGISFLYRSKKGKHWFESRIHILVRALLLLPLGLWLQGLDHGVLVILQFYAVYFVFGALFVGLSNRWLLAIALAVFVFGPIAHETAQAHAPDWFHQGAPQLGDSARKIARDLLLTGYYPLVTWGAPLALGIWIGRQNLSANSVRLALSGAGILLIAVASSVARMAQPEVLDRLNVVLANAPHNQSITWIAGAIGSAMLVLGLSLLLTGVAGRLLWPLAAAGQLALSIYVGHLLLLHWNEDLLRHDTVGDASISVSLFLLATIVFSMMWRHLFSHGPLEALFRLPSWLMEPGSKK